MNRLDVFNRVKQVGIIPALRSSNPSEAVHAAAAIQEGGISVIEVSLALPGALQVLEAVARIHANNTLVGAGSVVDVEGVRRASHAGARFIVTPGFSSEAVAEAARLDLAIFVGAITPTEVQIASASGADAVKLFPCYAMGGPRYLKSLRGQYPHVAFIASGGVGLSDCIEYFLAGACAIGVGGEIADAESMASGNHRLFTVRSKRFLKVMNEAGVLRDNAGSVEAEKHR